MRESDENAWHLYERSVRQRRLSDLTLGNARQSLEKLSAALPDGTDLLGAAEADVEKWLAGLAAARRPDGAPRYSSSTCRTHYRRAHAFYAWAVKREYVEASPMDRLERPREDAPLIPLPSLADVTAVLEACRGKDWQSRRDHAMLRILLEAGSPRASELGGLTLDRLDMRRDRITVLGKGGLERTVPFGEKTGHALTLWLRARAGQRLAGVPQVFFTRIKPMDRNGVYRVITARCRTAGVEPIPPHHWRHLSAHEWAHGGGSDGDAMKLFGWRTASMAQLYGAAAAESRAIEHAIARGQGDRI